MQKRTTDGYKCRRFFIAVLHGGDWRRDANTLADGPFYFGQALRKITGTDVSNLKAGKDDGDLWVKFWQLSSFDAKIDISDPYSAVERYLTDTWIEGPLPLAPFDSGGVCVWLDRDETGHMTMNNDGTSIVLSEETQALVRAEIEEKKVCMLHSIMFC